MIELQSLVIEDFRSINGKVTIPLDAPIVLLHGVNGAGKTSVLSALELALTGKVESLQRVDEAAMRHLVHRGKERAIVTLSGVSGSDQRSARLTVSEGGRISGAPLLDADDRRTFAERCYLAQATVGRLLEIYQHSGSGESPLTRFVKDLLGLDKVEALVDGLHPVGDIRRIRNLVPEVAQQERRSKELIEELGRQSARRSGVLAAVAAARDERASVWMELYDGAPPEDFSEEHLVRLRAEIGEQLDRMGALEAARQELAGLRRRASDARPGDGADLRSLEVQLRESEEENARWQGTAGNEFRAIMAAVETRMGASAFPDLGIEESFQRVAAFVSSELARSAERLRVDSQATADAKAIETQLGASRERSARLLAAADSTPERLTELSSLLAGLLEHVVGDTCPVCGRDFGEISSHSLADHLAARASSLNAEALKLRSVLASVNEEAARERELRARLSLTLEQRLLDDERLSERMRLAELEELDVRLRRLAPHIPAGAEAARKLASLKRALSDQRNRVASELDARRALEQLAVSLGAGPLSETDSLQAGVDRLTSLVDARAAALDRRRAAAAQILELSDALGGLGGELAALDADLGRLMLERSEVQHALENFERLRSAARGLAAVAESARSAVVKEVFNHSLNRIWRDLFVRLVPSEPFVPAFQIATGQGGRAVAQLETRHRDGGLGGNPSAVLSSGNLNTGAVTLFLALHLSARPRIPWLFLDDPVQSMDEVHIAQFAALLRVLAKEHGRRIVIAVHERSLFEYLALELSPACPGDRLVAVELTRPDGQGSLADPDFRSWRGDPLLDATA